MLERLGYVAVVILTTVPYANLESKILNDCCIDAKLSKAEYMYMLHAVRVGVLFTILLIEKVPLSCI